MIRGFFFLGFLALLPLWVPLGLDWLGVRISLLPLASSWVKAEPAGSDGTAPPAGWREHVYLARNPDVAAAVRQGTLRSGYEHYVRFGQAEGRTGGLAATAAAPPAPPPAPVFNPVTAAPLEAPPPSPPASAPPVAVAAVPAAPRTPPQASPPPSPPTVGPIAVPPAKPPVPGPGPAAQTAPSAVLVSGIRAGAHDGFTRIVLDVSTPPRLERAARSAPRAVGIEMPNAVWRMARQGRLTAKALGYRVEEGARGASRLTIESPDPIQLKSMFVLPPEGDRGYRVVLDVARAAR